MKNSILVRRNTDIESGIINPCVINFDQAMIHSNGICPMADIDVFANQMRNNVDLDNRNRNYRGFAMFPSLRGSFEITYHTRPSIWVHSLAIDASPK